MIYKNFQNPTAKNQDCCCDYNYTFQRGKKVQRIPNDINWKFIRNFFFISFILFHKFQSPIAQIQDCCCDSKYTLHKVKTKWPKWQKFKIHLFCFILLCFPTFSQQPNSAYFKVSLRLKSERKKEKSENLSELRLFTLTVLGSDGWGRNLRGPYREGERRSSVVGCTVRRWRKRKRLEDFRGWG